MSKRSGPYRFQVYSLTRDGRLRDLESQGEGYDYQSRAETAALLGIARTVERYFLRGPVPEVRVLILRETQLLSTWNKATKRFEAVQ